MSSGGGTVWIMGIAWALVVSWTSATGMEDRCLPGGKHKASPSPEGQLGICQIYAESEYWLRARRQQEGEATRLEELWASRKWSSEAKVPLSISPQL